MRVGWDRFWRDMELDRYIGDERIHTTATFPTFYKYTFPSTRSYHTEKWSTTVSGHDTLTALDLARFNWQTASAMSSARIGRSPQFCF